MTDKAGSGARRWWCGRAIETVATAPGGSFSENVAGGRGRKSVLYSLSLSFVLAGCGGGGSSGSSPPATGSEATQQAVSTTADAGPDQTVAELSIVQLNGNGTGSGTLSYQWTQTSGTPALALGGADQAVANFEAPDVDSGAPQDFGFELTVTDDSGKVARDTVSVTVQEETPTNVASGQPPTLAGTISYESVPIRSNCRGLDYSGTELLPVRGATVQLVDATTNSVIDTVTASDQGEYTFTVSDRRVFLRVRAELKRSGSPGWDVEVRDNTSRTSLALANRPLYVLDSAPVNMGSEGRELHLVADSGWDGSAYTDYRAAAPFAALDTIYAGIAMVLDAEPQAFFPPLDVFWSVNNTTAQPGGVQIDRGEIGNSFYNPAIDSLFLLGKADDDTEEYDSHVIAHEWGHYFEDNFSRSDSIGGPHNLGQRLDMRLAFGEGWASGLAGIILENPVYCDTSGVAQSAGFGFDMDWDRFGKSGWFNEVSVSAIMYDLWDGYAGDDDAAGIGFAPVYQALIGEQADTPAFTSIFSFASALKALVPDQALVVDTLLQNHGVTGIDAYGRGEQNDSENGTAVDVLPVFTDIFPDGEAVRICSNGQYGPAHSGNKLSVFRYLRLPLDQASRIRITVQNVNPPTSPSSPAKGCQENFHSDPDFLLFSHGQVVHKGVSCKANVEDSTTALLAAGDYAMTVSEYRFADDNPEAFAAERSCFDVKVSPVQ
jgi:hypothetical protein